MARKDRGILNPKDLKGKRIGFVRGTTGEYFLSMLLLLHNVREKETIPVPMPADRLPEAILSGRIDAATMWEPFVSDVERGLGGAAQIFTGAGFYRSTWILTASTEFAKQRQQTVKRMLRALIKAEDFINNHSDEALKISANYLGVSRDELAPTWDSYFFDVALERSLIVSFENQARWARARHPNLASRPLPNFLNYISDDALEDVRKRSVTIGRYDD